MVSKAAREFIAKHPDWNKPKPKKKASTKKREKGEQKEE